MDETVASLGLDQVGARVVDALEQTDLDQAVVDDTSADAAAACHASVAGMYNQAAAADAKFQEAHDAR